ncbi:sodium/pantothenate symporter [Pasteurella multocida]|uniref:PanF n=2 Tax=Pasteurella multocida TaxID=747 RepID=Q9CLW1_PASMU|nr:sodium/pantothenate symporter [Pasteurella multocida]EGP04690.1 sodium/panthothenate symporter [Pasteurella multocida subsp. multocida str. Anand1_goat]AAK03173.1 PanF [Pasteurella multocida subsp. multocida str. Pm70]AFF23399.1 sodium/panthothenate symporter [Pasteurella multocida subsp. multocida str. HN06]AKD40954.1 sodium/panthothenate symporter [Pasteurella multocida OH1905]APW54660.1 sodium/pantothenate symporter [Pasteurella multocida subsp. multocida str. HN07]
MNYSILIPLFLYLCFVFAVAYYAYAKRQKGSFLSEYYVGNRSMSGFVLAMTTAATYVGASSFIGGPGAAYKFGLGWVLLAMIQVPVVLFTLGVLGKKFAMWAREHKSLTINDILFSRYKSPTIVLLASLSLLFSFFIMMAVQFIGVGRLLETTLNIDYRLSVLIFATTVGIYTFIGGFRAVVLTDTIQGLIMMIGTFLLLFGVIYAGGGVSQIIDTLETIDPRLITPYGIEARPLDFTFMASFWVLVCFGLLGLPHTVIRAMSYKNSKALHSGIVIGTVVIALLMLGMHLAGALGRAVVPELSVTDKIIPTLMIQVLPPVVAGIFLAAPMAAIMSSIDSMLIQASSTLIKDLYLRFKPEQIRNERRVKILSTVATLFMTILVTVATLNPPDMLIWLNLFALGGLETTFLWVMLLGLYWQKANAYGAVCSMIVGLGSYVTLTAASIKLLDFHAIVPALLFGLIAFLIGNQYGERKIQH